MQRMREVMSLVELEAPMFEPRDETVSERAREILRGARSLVAAGWTQGRYHERTILTRRHRYCASGAIRRVAEDSFGAEFWVGYQANELALAEAVGVAFIALARQCENVIPDWNDAPGRTQTEVLAAFDRAIASI